MIHPLLAAAIGPWEIIVLILIVAAGIPAYVGSSRS